ncbi:sensor histidine kinase [Haliscomenobacter hydrossis]|uniref:histidine kinase n=1 Tax=Haliscomenobacter hydrossis (strain ATCC 27775 / DSM 1100 / LMG 10767 / O) TaxID=760192 RepID=F4KRA5_HALH1|nr:ATP-binding protein [Haliscomenobacter hydrossis]AEE54292.1 multi-sensor signal transduction histidine kinase [Haliscomenobacter hydrossis DSM 1100]
MTLQRKIALGSTFLFLLLLLISGVSTYYISVLKNDTQEVLKDNYESVSYCHAMITLLDTQPSQYTRFDDYLQKQENNVTETGEKAANLALRKAFQQFSRDSTQASAVRKNILHILHINMQAIQRKNDVAISTARRANLYISTLAAFLFLIAFTFVLNFPGLIAEPIKKFNEAIQELSRKNYNFRMHMDAADEFGQLAGAINQMASKLDEYENSNVAQLMFEKKRAEAVINSLDDASIGVDKHGTVLFANQKALQLLGLEAAETIGQATSTLAQRNDLLKFMLENPSGTSPFKIVMDNRENYFLLDSYKIQVDEEPGIVFVLKNITTFLEKDVAKTNFLATISHELKTPISGIKLGLQLLENPKTGALNSDQLQLLQDIKYDSDRLLRITSELLNMTQLETGKIDIKLEAIDPSELVGTALQALFPQTQEKKLQLSTQFAPNLPKVWCDPEKTIWVLINLLSNAIRHASESDRLTVSIESQGQQVLFSIQDQGPGIAPEFQEKIFEKYVKAPGSKSTGTGLGLAISRDFVEAMGGKIGVNSQLGHGATFFFDLPQFQE